MATMVTALSQKLVMSVVSLVGACAKRHKGTCKELCNGDDGDDECGDAPTTCEECVTLSRDKKCFKPQLKTCVDLGWTKKGCNGDDEDDCGDAPTTCEECVELSKNKKCFKPQMKTCAQDFGWTKKGCGGDEEDECGDAPTTCQECVTLSRNKKCFKPQLDNCIDLGWTKKGCVEPIVCNKTVPSTCEMCQNLGIECIKQEGHGDTCKRLKYNPKNDSCPELCAQGVPASCDACKALSPQCLKPHKATCKNLCSGDGDDNDCGDAPTTCEECVTLSRNKKCFKPVLKTCVGFGWTKKGCEEGDDECTEPSSCDDCKALSKSCLKKNKDFGTLCKEFGFSKGKCRSNKG